MKKLSIKSKILCLIIIGIIVAGAIVVGIKGFNFDLRYREAQNIEIYIGNEFNLSDIRQITNDVFGKEPVMLQKVEVYEDSVLITAPSISDDQKNSVVNKVNEKYSLELKGEDISIETAQHVHLRDIVRPYVIPIVTATLIILAYIGIRYHKLGVIKSIFKAGIILVIAELVLFGLMAITRFPIGRYTLPLVLFVYLITTIGITSNLEKNLAKKKEEEKKIEAEEGITEAEKKEEKLDFKQNI